MPNGQALAQARAPAAVESFVEEHRPQLHQAIRDACDTHNLGEPERLTRFAEDRLRVRCVYGVSVALPRTECHES